MSTTLLQDLHDTLRCRPTLDAYHEAAHALMAFLSGSTVEFVTISPNPDRGYAGKCRYTEPPMEQSKLAVALAGPMAESVAAAMRGQRADLAASESDVQAVVNTWLKSGGSKQTLKYLLDAAVSLVQDTLTHHWTALDWLACRLTIEKTLSGRQVKSIIGSAMGRAA
jgi:hypothetical protein